MPNAIEDRREEVGVLVEAEVLRVEIDVLVLRVLGASAMTGLHSVKLKQHCQGCRAYPGKQIRGQVVEGWFRGLRLRVLNMVGKYMG
jgi:hypothetical protein